MDNLYNFKKKADKMNTWSNWMNAIIATMFFSFIELFTCFPNDKNIHKLELFVKYFAIIGSSLSLTIYSLKALDYDDSFKEMNCSDSITNSNYNIMIEKLRKSGKFIFWVFILLIIVVCINIICVAIRIYLWCKQTALKHNDEKGDDLMGDKKKNENVGNKDENININEDNGNKNNEKIDDDSINDEGRNSNKRMESEIELN